MKRYKKFIEEISLGRAGSYAATKHAGQYRSGSGASYIIHPTYVVKILKRNGETNKDVLAAAYLHDTIEDTDTTYDEIVREFNKTVAEIVKEVTSSERGLKKYGKPKYLTHKMIKMSDDALKVKLADRLHNVRDSKSLPDKRRNRIKKQTLYIVDELKSKRSLKPIHKKLINKILNVLGE